MAAKKLGTWSTCEDVAKALADGAKDVATKTVIVTGASAGIGKEAAFQLAKLGAHVVMGCRNVEKGEKVLQELQTRGGGKLEMTCMKLDVSDLESVKAFAESFLADSQEHGWKPLTCLVLNAGIFPSTAGKSKQDLELTFATNHLGHFLLTQLLLPTLRENKPSRVVVVSSLSHYGPLTLGKKHLESEQALKEKLATPGYKSMGLFRAAKVYGDTKLCNVLFTKELHEREKDNGVTAACLHPGTLITTDIARDTPGCFKFMFQYVISHFTKNVNQGAGTTLFLSLCPAEEMKGLYFDACKPKKESKLATPTACATLWGLSTTLCQGFLPSSN